MENTIYRQFLSVIQCYYNLMCLGGKYRIMFRVIYGVYLIDY